MVVITIPRKEGQDGKPTNRSLLKTLAEVQDLKKIPHQFFFPEVVLKNLIVTKRAVLKNREAYIKSGGGNKMTSAVIIVDGKSDSGKSTIASQMGLFFDPSITLEKNYCWNIDRLMWLIEHSYPGMVILLDEGMFVNSRKANSDDNIKLIIALSQMRSKGVFLIICINSVHQLEKTIPLTRANFLVHVKRIGGISGTPKYCCYEADKMRDLVIKNSGKYSYGGVLPNTDWATFSRYFPFEDTRYDKMKHSESLKNLDAKVKVTKTQQKVQLGLMKLMEHCKNLGFIKTYAEFGKITGMSASTLADYKRRYPGEIK